jgi:hypothetical protein
MRPGGFSTAVVARRSEPADSLDYFPTPPWATRAFCEHVLPAAWPYPDAFRDVWEPACGEGHMAAALGEYFTCVLASDIFPYGYGEVGDFLLDELDWIITNPPFNHAEKFVRRGLEIARRGVAVLVRTAFLEGQGRHRNLYSKRPPQLVAQFVERVPMHKGRWVPNGKTATSYCWIVWLRHPPHNWLHTRMIWIPPGCRKALTRHDDAARFGAATPAPLLEGQAS